MTPHLGQTLGAQSSSWDLFCSVKPGRGGAGRNPKETGDSLSGCKSVRNAQVEVGCPAKASPSPRSSGVSLGLHYNPQRGNGVPGGP